MAEHFVQLPHPRAEGETVGECVCGWRVTYVWGGHEAAANEAGDHIQTEALARPIEAVTLRGERRVFAGASL